MRFEGAQVLDAPPRLVLRALRDPAILEACIPNCTRIEAQPGYRPDQSDEVILGIEIGTANPTTGAEPIVGWIEAVGLTMGLGLHFSLTLDDGVTNMRANGTLRLSGRDHDRRTELRYTLDAGVVGQPAGNWSPAAIVTTQRTIAQFAETLVRLVETPDLSFVSPVVAPAAAAEQSGGVQVLVESRRGQVVWLPAHPVPSPTQGMLRRVDEMTAARSRQIMRWWAMGAAAMAVVGLVGGALVWRQRRHR